MGDDLTGRSHLSPDKKVDESWKDAVQKEKSSVVGAPQSQAEKRVAKADPLFPEFLSTLAMQALLALGDAENPSTGQKNDDLGQAQFLIETLRMLSEKMQGNLTREEETVLRDLLYDLQMRFVEKQKESAS